MEVPEQLRITWSRGAEFLEVLDRDPPGRYSVQMPGPDRVLRGTPIGKQISVELAFVDTNRTFRHIGCVVAYAPGPPEVITFEFLAEQRSIRDLIVWHALGRSVPYLHRRAERHLVWLPVEVQIEDRWKRGFATELSELGIFVTMPNPPGTESTVHIRIRTEDGRWLELPGRVVYTRGTGSDIGFAAEFAFTTRSDEVRIGNALRAALYNTKRS